MTITVQAGQLFTESLVEDNVLVKAATIGREALVTETAQLRIPLVFREVLISGAALFAAQLYREILTWDAPTMTVPAPYPTLALGFSVFKRAIGGSTAVAKAASGREIRINYWTYPEWEWDLTYEMLPDAGSMQAGVTASDIKTLVGFLLVNFGSFVAFPFLDPDDNAILGQSIGTGDGATTSFLLVKNYGLGGLVGLEPIGYLNQSLTLNVYVDGVLKTAGTDYTTSLASPYRQTIVFTTPPAAGKAVTVDMNYYFMTRIKEDTGDFEKFMEKLWTNKKLTLVSLKGT